MQESCAVMSHMNESRSKKVGPLRIELMNHVESQVWDRVYKRVMRESCAVTSHMNESWSKIVGTSGCVTGDRVM